MQKIRTKKDYVGLTAKGMAMGAADVVPGVSGGTIAFITGIYDELLDSIKRCGPHALKLIFTEGFASAWRYVNGWFLLSVFGGILLSMKTFASGISYALANHPLLVWAFFSGLIIASVYLLAKEQDKWAVKQWGAFTLGIVFVVAVSIAKPAQAPAEWWMLFIGGFIAICAMILPGISGSFLLLLMGLYPVFIDAIKTFDIVSLASFGSGCIVGLLLFSRFLSWLLHHHYKNTIALLIGFLVGSLNVTWPWKETLSTFTNRHGKEVALEQANVLPTQFTLITQSDNQLMMVISMCIFGAVLVVGLEFIASKMK